MSCHLTKKVPKEKYLLTKNVFIINGKKVHFSSLENYVKQKPNKKILNFFPIKLMMYNSSNPDLEEVFSSFFSIPKEHRNKKVLNHLLKRISKNNYSTKRIYWNWFLLKNGEKPIIIDNNLTKDSIQNLNSHFYSKGYLDAHTDFSLLKENEKKGKIIYNIYTGNPYFINSIIYNFPEKELKDIYLNNLNSSLIKEGGQYNETNLILEIERMKNMYEDHGYYNFDISNVKFRIDPSIGNQKINLYMEVDKGAPSPNKHRKYFFNEIVIRINQEENHSIFYNGYKFFIPNNKKFNPKIITDILTITPGSLYKKKDILSTQQNISSLHNFNIDQFKIEEKRDHNKNSLLNVEIFLSTLKDHELKFHIENSISKRMDIGIHPGVTLLSRNFLKNGANLMLSIKGNFISSKKEFLNMSKFSLQGKLIYPSYIYSFIEQKKTLYRLPTSIIFQINSQKNMGVRRILFSSLLNYEWKENPYRKHKIKITNFKLVKNLEQEENSHKEDIIYGENFFCKKKNKIYPEKEILHCKNDKNQNFFFDQRNPIRTKKIKKTFEEYIKMKRENVLFMEDYLISSIIYNYEMNQTLDKRKRNPFVLRENIEISGNILSPLFRKTSFIKKKWNNIPSYSFFKYDLSFKRFCFLKKYHTLVSKLFFGVIFTYKKLPFEKSYLLRESKEFQTWDSFYTKIIQPEKKKTFFENFPQTKFLLVHEYRYEILSKLISVIFLDLGNIWFLNNKKKNSKEIGNFKWNSFYKELTLGGGIGFRYDLKFFIFRIDFAYKFYDPYQKEGKKWVISHLKIQDPLMNFGIHSPLPF